MGIEHSILEGAKSRTEKCLRECKAKEKRVLTLEREREKLLTNKQECTSVWHKDLRVFNLL